MTEETDSPSPRQNHLLDALPQAEYERIFPHLEWVPMPLGEVLYEPGGELRHTCRLRKPVVQQEFARLLQDLSGMAR